MTEKALEVVPLAAVLFDSWRDDLSNRWALLRSESGRVTLQEGLVSATRIIDKRLSAGLDTDGQHILAILDAGNIKGIFWLEIKDTKGFLYDLVLNKSIGIETLRDVIEKEASARGALELRVNVFSGDQFLKALTSSGAYKTVSSQMWLLDNPAIRPKQPNLSLTTRPMKQDEFPEYLQRQIDTYAAEKVAAGKCAPEEAIRESKEEIAKLLPDGLKSEDQYIFVAEFQNERIGTVWVDIDRELEVPRAFGLYIEIEPSLRGQGLGRELMYATQLECRKLGAKGFALSVFGHNFVAKTLYESFGFAVTEEMKKRVLAG